MIPLIEKIINCDEKKISKFLFNSFRVINKYLGIDTKLILSSDIPKDNSLRGQDKVIAICKILNATEYYNAIGGMNLYNRDDFLAEGIDLKFLHTNEIRYKQFHNEFQPNLSIIDVMMFCSVDEIKNFLNEYTLINSSDNKGGGA